MKHSHALTKIVVSTAFTLFSAQAAVAGPGTLINSPLFVNSNAKPNIMILTDDSGSMRHVVPEDGAGAADKYNSATTYIANCGAATVPDAREDAGTDSLYIRIVGGANGKPEISINSNGGASDPLGTTAGTICFNSTKTYNASLYADGGTTAAGSATAIYTGNYLNWYFDFDNTATTWNTGQPLKPGTDYRMNITRTTLKSIVTSLDDNVRIGLATLTSETGANIRYPVTTLTGTTATGVKKAILDEIDTFDQGGFTPMAEALHQVGRYFLGDAGTTNPGNLAVGSIAEVNGQTSGTGAYELELYPGTASSAFATRTALFPTMASNGTLESPIQYWCQNNFVIFMSDGVSRRDTIIPPLLQDYDSDCNAAVPACNSRDRKTVGSYIYDPNDGSDYLDDVAQALYDIDLRPDINDYDTPPKPVKNNISTYTIAFADQDALNNLLLKDAADQSGGQYFTSENAAELASDFAAATNGILATTSSAAAVTFNTSTLGSDTAVYQALFSTAFWSGDIKSYPIIIDIADPTINGSVDFTCTPDVDTNCWSAATHLDALSYDAAASPAFLDQREIITFDTATKKGIAFTTPADFTAPAADEITATMINDLCAGPDAPLVGGVACTSATPAAKTASQQYVDRMVDYVRGDRTFEDTVTTPTFRTRETVLGDIINAAPIFSGVPNADYPSYNDISNPFGEGDPALPTGKRYSNFQTAQASRDEVLYVSANDGMLHAIRAEAGATATRNLAGDELFAYIPSFVFSNQANEGLHHLAEPTYNHKYYLDLTPTYRDVYIKAKDTSITTGPDPYKSLTPDWHTVLIGGSRGGLKRGIFALNITDPVGITQANAADKILWEFTNADDADLGYTYSKPTIVLTHAIGGDGLPRWAAIFGNGYQNDDVASFPAGASCHAILYVVFLDGGLDGTWTLGTNPATADYMKLDTGVGTTTAGGCNGLSTPRLVHLDGDKIIDRVYAGDVQGNMWAFDLTCSGAGCGNNDFDVAYKQGATPKPLFTATDPLGNPQPIMQRPVVAFNTQAASPSDPNLIVMFGTGQYHTSADVIPSTKTNTFYGIWDKGTDQLVDDRTYSATAALAAGAATPAAAQLILDAGSYTLVEQVITETTTAYGDLRQITSNLVDWDTRYGWYIDLAPQDAANLIGEERVVVNPAVRGSVLFFNTVIPESQICGFGGSGWLMSVNLFTGGATSSTVFDVDGDGIVDDNDNIGGNTHVGQKIEGIPADSSFISDYQYTQSSNKDIGKRKICPECGPPPPPPCPVPPCGPTEDELGRRSWRELIPEN